MIENAISEITQEDVNVAASGRTDAGAHALQQVVAFSITSTLPADDLHNALNAQLPGDIAVTSVVDVESDFHPRFDALSRIYRYLIWNRPVRSPLWSNRAWHVKKPLDAHAMNEAAQELLGSRDFRSFVPVRQSENSTRSVLRAECQRDGNLVVIELEGSGFKRQMVRSIVGTLVEVGLGKANQADFERVVRVLDRREAGETVPSYGLYLTGVLYHRCENPSGGAGPVASSHEELERFARYS